MKHTLKSNYWIKTIALGNLSLNLYKNNELLHIHEIATIFDVNLVLQFSHAEISNLWADAKFLYNKRSYDKLKLYCKWVQKIDPNFEYDYHLSALATINKKGFFEEDNEQSSLYTNFNAHTSVALCSYNPNFFMQ